jgi:GNAT superfamily N-acetyltransferase
VIRPAQPEDVPALAAILSDWIVETGWMPVLHTEAETRAFMRHLVLTCEVTVAGLAAPVGFVAREGEEVRCLYLAPGARGMGLGKALLDGAKARSDRLSLWAFQANVRAVDFYHREGFAEVARTDGQGNDERLPDLRMVWERAMP